MYHTVWNDFADWYLETSKTSPNPGVLAYGLETILKLAHPFAPFVTETIWQTLKWEGDSLLIISSWPNDNVDFVTTKSKEFSQLQAIIIELRAMITKLNLTKPVLYHADEPLIASNADMISKLARLEKVSPKLNGNGLHLTTIELDAWVEIDPQIARNYIDKLDSQRTEQALHAERLLSRLANKSYAANAPKKLVQETEKQLEEVKQQLVQINSEIDTFTEVISD